MKTSSFVIVEIPLPLGVRARALRVDDIRLAFYNYAVVEEGCYRQGWGYDELDLDGDEVLNNVIRVQELVEERNLF